MQTCNSGLPSMIAEAPINKREKPYSKISQLVQERHFQKAQDLLYRVPENDEHWHYLNALIHFSISGDTIIARTALTNAMTLEPLTALQLMTDYPVEMLLAQDFAKEITPDKIEYWSVTRPAWEGLQGAFPWLEENCMHPLAIVNRETIILAVHKGDARRWERWERYQTDAGSQFEKGQLQHAIQSYKKALEYAEQISYSYIPFAQSMLWLLLIYLESGKSTSKFEEQIYARAEKLNHGGRAKDPLIPLHLHSFGTLLCAIGKYEKAEPFLTDGIKLFSQAIAENSRAITLFEDLQTKNSLATMLFAAKRYSEAIALVLKNISLKALYLGDNHEGCAADLKLAYKIYNALGDGEGKKTMAAKLTAIRERQYQYFREVPDQAGRPLGLPVDAVSSTLSAGTPVPSK